MPNSFVSVRATEGQTTFPFSFPNGYLSEDHIRTYVDGTEVSRTISGGTAIIDPVAAEQEVVVARQSPQTPYIAFEDGSILNKQNIDTQNRHAFMLAEEAAEQRDFFALGDIDMNYHKIIHVSPGTDQYDVVNKGQFDYFLTVSAGHADRAEDAADEAALSASSAGNSASAASQSAAAAADSAQFAADQVAGFDTHVADAKAEVTLVGDQQVARVISEGDIQYSRAKTEADRAQGYAEILERPYEDMGAHTIGQGYPPVPSFSSMWVIIDGGLDPIDGVTTWNAGDILLYSAQNSSWSRLAGSLMGGGGGPVPIEILDDLIMQQGKKIRFRVDEFVDTVGLELDTDGDLVVGEIPTTPSTAAPAVKLGLAASELYHVPSTDAGGAAVKHKILTEQTGLKNTGIQTINSGKLVVNNAGGNLLAMNSDAGKSCYMLGQEGGVNKWYIGVGSDGSSDVYLSSYTHTNHIALKADRVTAGKKFYAPGAEFSADVKVAHGDAQAKLAAGSNSGVQMLSGTGVLKWNAYYEPGNNQYRIAQYNADGVYVDSPVTIDSAGAVMLKTPKSQGAQGTTADSLVRYDYLDKQLPGRTAKIPGSADLNTYQTAGFYYQDTNADATSGSNYPEDAAGALTVYRSAGVTQEYRIYNSARVWRRGFYGSAWTAWVKDYDSANKPTAMDIAAARQRAGIASGGDWTGRTLAIFLLTLGGRNYPLVCPLTAGSYWVRNRGGENADRDYDFGVTIGGSAPNFTYSVAGSQGAVIQAAYGM